MENRTTRPVLMTKVQRKYGRCDFERFDNVASSTMSAGRGKIGKVEVDARFLFTKSQWGVLGGHPGGIIYLDLDFLQPADCRLCSATVLVTLEEDRREADNPEAEADGLACPVKFTDYYGPKSLRGPERVMRTRRIKNFTPTVHVLGNGAGGLGVDVERTIDTTSRWKLASQIKSTEGHIWYNQLRWELKENSLEEQSMHSNVIHTGFALEHNAKRFYMTVKISGKLAHRSERIKQRFKKFGSSIGKEEETVTTLIEWKNGYSCPRRLDKIAEGLSFAMECENLANIPIELPDALPAGFTQTATNQMPEMPSGRPEVAGAEIFPELEDDDQTWPEGRLTSSNPNLLRMSSNLHRPPEPTVENMSLAAGLSVPLLDPPSRVAFPLSESRWSTTMTLVENGAESTSGRSAALRRRKRSEENPKKAQTERRRHGSSAADLYGLIILLTWLTKAGLLCVTVIADAFGIPLVIGSKSWPLSIRNDESKRSEKDLDGLEDESDAQDASDGETLISPSSSPVMRRTAFKRGLENGFENSRRRAYMLRGLSRDYTLQDASE